jgi:hypothetical protein
MKPTTEILYYTDSVRGTVVIGSAGFVWWTKDHANLAPFPEPTRHMLSRYNQYRLWDSVKQIPRHKIAVADIVRFVRFGFLD